jgi:hypothetical protein
MGNDKKGPGLYCQKCRTPIDVDASIDQLNPAAFKLLTGMMPAPSHCSGTASHTDTAQRLNRPNSAASAQRRPSSPDPPYVPLLSASDIRHGDTVGTQPYFQAKCTVQAAAWRPESRHVFYQRAHVRVDAGCALAANASPQSRPANCNRPNTAERSRHLETS